MARRAAPNEDLTQVTLTWVFSRSDLATVASVHRGPFCRYLFKILRSLVLRFLGSILGVHTCTRFRGDSTHPLPLVGYCAGEKVRLSDPLLGEGEELCAACSHQRRRETPQSCSAHVFAEDVSSLADASRSCGVGSREPGTDVHFESQSTCGFCQAPLADLLPPVPLVTLNLLLGHAQ